MPQYQLTLPSPRNWLIFCGGIGVAGSLTAFGLWYGHVSQASKSLLPDYLAQSTSFVPYFFRDSIPEGYSFKPSDTAYSSGLLSVRLTKPGEPDITISEQALPDNLRQADLTSKGDKVDTAAGSSTIDDGDGHFLGTTVTSDKQAVLILTTSDDSGDRASVIDIMKALRPLRQP